jgi:hypothetical protein
MSPLALWKLKVRVVFGHELHPPCHVREHGDREVKDVGVEEPEPLRLIQTHLPELIHEEEDRPVLKSWDVQEPNDILTELETIP